MAGKKRGLTLEELEKAVRSVYLIADPFITKFIVAMMISQRLQNDPIWTVIVAPPGGGKSEFVNMLSKCKGVHAISTITARTLVSGQKKPGHETSLLMKIGTQGIITFKDLTSLLSENKDDRAVIMGQLREIFDGKYDKTFGTGETISWKGKITVIAGSTYKIHSLREHYSAMGERFLFYNLIQPERIEVTRRAMDNQQTGDLNAHRERMSDLMQEYIDESVEIPEKLPKLEYDLQEKIILIAELATRARSTTERNWRSPKQEITEVYPPEMPTRFAASITALANALAIINYNETSKFTLTEDDQKILFKIGLDSVSRSKHTAMQELSKYDVLQTAGLATKIGFPTQTVRLWLEDLTALGIAEREPGSGKKGDRWKILPKYKDLIIELDHIEVVGGELEDEEGDNAQEKPDKETFTKAEAKAKEDFKSF